MKARSMSLGALIAEQEFKLRNMRKQYKQSIEAEILANEMAYKAQYNGSVMHGTNFSAKTLLLNQYVHKTNDNGSKSIYKHKPTPIKQDAILAQLVGGKTIVIDGVEYKLQAKTQLQ